MPTPVPTPVPTQIPTPVPTQIPTPVPTTRTPTIAPARRRLFVEKIGKTDDVTTESTNTDASRRRLGTDPSEDYYWNINPGQYDLPLGQLLLSPSSMFVGGWKEGPWLHYNDTVDKSTYPYGILTLMRSKELNGSIFNPYRSKLLQGTQVIIKIYRENGIGAHCGFPDSDSLDSYLGTGYTYPFSGRNPNMDPFIITSNYTNVPGFYLFDVRAWWRGTRFNHWKDARLDNVTRVIEKFNGVGPGCSDIGGCHGKGVCDYCSATCRCFEGYGKFDDLITVGRDIAANCSQRVCPRGRAIMDVAKSATIAHQDAECSNAGICDRTTGQCQCFPPWTGAACNRMSCPNNCSGHGKCMSMRAVVREANVVGGKNPKGPYNQRNIEYGNSFDAGSISATGVSTGDSIAWDKNAMQQCVCDSTWRVGFTRGARQLSEWFGADCSLRRCPTGDDPYTTVDERNCYLKNQLNPSWPEKGVLGNICHVDCSNRGTCDYKTGTCNCYEGFSGQNCGQSSRAGVHRAASTLPPDFWDYDNATIGQLIY